MKIGIANDHRGVEAKETISRFLEEKGYGVVNYGTNTKDAVDFPDYAYKLGKTSNLNFSAKANDELC